MVVLTAGAEVSYYFYLFYRTPIQLDFERRSHFSVVVVGC